MQFIVLYVIIWQAGIKIIPLKKCMNVAKWKIIRKQIYNYAMPNIYELRII
jgi:hypothetical protein